MGHDRWSRAREGDARDHSRNADRPGARPPEGEPHPDEQRISRCRDLYDRYAPEHLSRGEGGTGGEGLDRGVATRRDGVMRARYAFSFRCAGARYALEDVW